MKSVVNGNRVVFGPVRMCYVHLLEKYQPEGASEGKYSVTPIIPKESKSVIVDIKKAIDAAKEEAVKRKWGGKEPRKIELPLRDGDEKEGEEFHGHWYLNAKSSSRVGVVDRDLQPIEEEDEVYSGMWGLVSISFFGYSVSGNVGIGAALNNVKKTKDDTPFTGRTSAAEDFSAFDDDDDDDDL